MDRQRRCILDRRYQGAGHRPRRFLPGRASPKLDHATRAADPFHVLRVANRCLDKIRRRVPNETLGHRGRKVDPRYRIGKLLLAGTERRDDRGRNRMLLGLRLGDPPPTARSGPVNRQDSARDVYLTDDPEVAALLLDPLSTTGCGSCSTPVVSAGAAGPGRLVTQTRSPHSNA